MKDDPFEHIGDIHSAHNDPSDSLNVHSAMFHEQSIDPKALARWYQSSNAAIQSGHDLEPSREMLDPTLGYVKKVSVTIPVNMMLDGLTDEQSSEAVHSSDHTDLSAEAGGPTYSIKQSRFSLYAAFPPPPIVLRTNNHIHINKRYSSPELINAKRRLKRYSGFHGAIGMTSATHEEQGYADTTLSLNYRFPKMLSIPTPSQNLPMVGNMHSNLHMGANTKQSIGGTVTSLDGSSSICVDIGNPFPKPHTNLLKKSGILPPRLDRRSYTVSFTRDCVWLNTPMRVQGLMTLTPLPRPNWIVYGKKYEYRAINSSHTERLALVLSNLDSHKETAVTNEPNPCRQRPKVALSLGYGKDSIAWHHFPQSATYVPSVDITRDENKRKSSGYPLVYSAFIKVDVEQNVSSSQTCQSFIQYRHLGQALSLGTTLTRTFASSPFSRVGVGVWHAFENIWNRKLWKQGRIWWLLRLERGDANICIPLSIYPVALTTRDSFVRLFYASLASLIIDAIVGEILSGATSMLRVRFFQKLLGKNCIDEASIIDSSHAEVRHQEKELNMMAHQILSSRETALKQRDVMEKQSSRIAKKESDQGGLVIIKALYGVVDSETNQWLFRRNASNGTPKLYVLDATAQLQFWVNDSSLHMPATSKKNMLGFYDILASVSDQDRLNPPTPSSVVTKNVHVDSTHHGGVLKKISHWCKQQWKGHLYTVVDAFTRRDLKVILSVRYKFEDEINETVFLDYEAVDLPQQKRG